MRNYICVYDFETDGIDPQQCEPVQVAAIIVHPITLEIIPESLFVSYMRPLTINEQNYYQDHLDTILWHSKNYKTTPEKIYEKWKQAPETKLVIQQFEQYLRKYQVNNSVFGAPIRAGMNIRNFDNIILDRLCKEFKMIDKDNKQKLFHPRDVIDILDLAYYWFESLKEPSSYNMDNLRNFFGLSRDGSHDAAKDVYDEAIIITHFMKLMRKLAPKVKFKGALKDVATAMPM